MEEDVLDEEEGTDLEGSYRVRDSLDGIKWMTDYLSRRDARSGREDVEEKKQ